jgi:undecaprenyl-diphosphatase
MNWFEALILGIIQGLTEFLPVSSSGHLELGQVILGTQSAENMTFTIVVHGATVLSTIIVFYKEIGQILNSVFRLRWDENSRYFAMILLSMVPVAFVGLFLDDKVEGLFSGNLLLVGSMLLVTALLLAFTFFAKKNEREVTFVSALIIGIAQAFAVTPGISRSGTTIATALLLGINKERAARFSFLMVLIPIILANIRTVWEGVPDGQASIGAMPLIVGFLAALLSGLFACRLMIRIVNRGKLIYFALYCFIVGAIAIGYSII